MSLGQYAMTLKTEQSQKLHYSFCFKSEKNIPVLFDNLVDTPVKDVHKFSTQTTKLKSKAFYAWTKFLQFVKLNK